MDRLILFGISALAVTAPLVYSGYAYLIKQSFVHLAVTLVFGLWLVRVFVGREVSILNYRFLLPLVALLLVSLVSLVKAVNLEAGLRGVYRLSIYVIIYVVVVESLRRTHCWRFLAGSIVVGGVLTCLAGFYQFFNPGSTFLWAVRGQFIGFVGNRIYIGAYLLTVIPICASLFLLSSSRSEKATWALFLALLNVSIVLTRSRAAWLGLIIGLCLVVFLMQYLKPFREPGQKLRNLKNMLTVGLILAGSWTMGLLLFSVGESSQVMLLENSGSVNSLRIRLSHWSDTLEIIRENPLLGIGPDNFTFVFFRYAHLPQGPLNNNTLLEHPHNEYLNIVAELGFMGLIAFLWLVGRICMVGWREMNNARDRRQATWIVGLLGSLASIGVNANFSYPFHEPATAVNVILILSLIELNGEATYRETFSVGRRLWRMPAAIRKTAATAMLLVLAGLFYFLSFRPLLGSYYFVHEVTHFVRGHVDSAIRHAERALDWDRHAFLPRFLLSQSFFQTGSYRQAMVQSEELVRRHPYILYPHEIIAASYGALGDTEKAKASYLRVLEVNSRTGTALVNLGSLYMKEKHYDQARAVLERSSEAAPYWEQPCLHLGALNHRLQQFDLALDYYRRAVKVNSALPAGWYAIAMLEAHSGRPKEALQALGRAFSLDTSYRNRARMDPAFDAIRDHERFRRAVGE